MTGPHLSRRAVLAGGAALALLTACGGNDDDGGDSAADTGDGDLAGTLLTLIPAQGVLSAAGEVRIPVAVADPEGVPIRDDLAPRSFRVRTDAGELTVVEIEPRDDGVPTPYYPIRFTPEGPGIHEITVVEDGFNPISLDIAAEVPIPGVGEPLPPVATPTVEDPRMVTPICTRQPPCPLHAVSQEQALAAGGPVAYLIATPEFCQTAICGPVLDLLLEVLDEFPTVTGVHAEVYADPRGSDDPTAGGLAPAAEAYDLPFEPVLYVADEGGIITARYDSVFDRSELREALSAVS